MDPFETDEEKEERQKRTRIIASLFVIIIIISAAAWWWWEENKPLPNTDRCIAEGYEAGVKTIKGDACYRNCDGNEISSCRVMRLL